MPDFSRGPFYEIFKIPNFRLPPLASPAPFSRAMGQKSNFCSQHVFTSSSHFQKGVTWPPCPKTLGGDGLAEKSIFWVWAGSKLHVQKLHAMSQVDPENLTTIWPWSQKLFHIVAVTDGHTFWIPLSGNFLLNYFMHGGWKTSKPANFLPFYFMKNEYYIRINK